MRILLVDDDESIVKILTNVLLKQNYVVDVAMDGKTGWEFIESFQYDLVLLDVMLPKLDGINFCRRLREQKNPVLVMLLTARDTINDKLVGLDSGADDYVIKPFNVQELAARIRALIRRGSTSSSVVLTCGDLHLDPNLHEVTYKQKLIKFSRKEYLLVELFIRNQKRVYSCRDIVDHLWSFDDEPPNESTVRSHIKNIRRELKAVGADNLLETVYGQGYKINTAFLSAQNDQSVPNSTKQETLNNSVAEVWKQTKKLTFERLTALEQIIFSVRVSLLDETLRQQAIQNAHKLAGSLGMFGFEEGSKLAKKIELILESDFQLKSHFTAGYQEKVAQKLEPLMITLRQEIEGSDKEPINSNIIDAEFDLLAPINAKILAVDDDPQILKTLRILLEPLGVRLTCLENPQHFWETLKSTCPDFLILDINMPSGTEGLDLCRAVRRDHQWNWLPILFLTSCNDTKTLQQAFINGADDYINKPIVLRELSTRIINRLQRVQTLKN